MFMNMSAGGRTSSRLNYVDQEESLTLPALLQDGVDVMMRPAANPPPSRSSATTVSLDDEQAPPALVPPSPPPPAVIEHDSSDTVFSPLTKDPDEKGGQNANEPSMDLAIRQREGNAKAKLHERYAEVKLQIPSKHFVTWSDGRRPHENRFTSIFVCPRTGEMFPSGELIEDGGHAAHGLCWYATKQKAKEAAAGKAEDCFSLREGDGGYQFCNEQPREGTIVDLRAVLPQYLKVIEKLRSQMGRY
jgi:hypothetical protein